MFRLFFPFVLLSLVFSSTASASLAVVPPRETWSLATDDVIAINQAAGTATGRVYLAASDGVLIRATAKTTAARLLTVAETSLTGGKGNPWLIAAIAAGSLAYEGYQWYKTDTIDGSIPIGTCIYLNKGNVTMDECAQLCIPTLKTSAYSSYNDSSLSISYTGPVESTTPGQFNLYYSVTYKDWHNGLMKNVITSTVWRKTGDRSTATTEKKPISTDEASSILFALLATANSSRNAFSEANQPYPLDGLFEDADLDVDPTYSPAADITAQNLPDYITKYNNGLLQSTDPSKPNYVSPSQYQYVKSQAEAAAATAAGGTAANTDPLSKIEQPITQAQYDESNKKTDDAAKSAVDSQSLDGFGDKKSLDDGNDKLSKISEGGIEPLSPFNLPSLPQSSTCQSVTWEFMGQTLQIPGTDGCARLADLKRIFGYLLYVLTAIAIIWKATEKPLE